VVVVCHQIAQLLRIVGTKLGYRALGLSRQLTHRLSHSLRAGRRRAGLVIHLLSSPVNALPVIARRRHTGQLHIPPDVRVLRLRA
jgi:hypothetical protein